MEWDKNTSNPYRLDSFTQWENYAMTGIGSLDVLREIHLGIFRAQSVEEQHK